MARVEILYTFLVIAVLILSFALFSNRFRRTAELPFELTPNCLMTRWPVVFITGKRSLFYFQRYWNLYPIYLAEHGYEVYTVHLPWKSTPFRQERFRHLLQGQKEANKSVHLVMDEGTHEELKKTLEDSEIIKSVTLISKSSLHFSESPSAPSPLSRAAHFLHRSIISPYPAPSLNELGAHPLTAKDNAALLLERIRTLAENDLND